MKHWHFLQFSKNGAIKSSFQGKDAGPELNLIDIKEAKELLGLDDSWGLFGASYLGKMSKDEFENGREVQRYDQD